jgi:hypothetical protein
VHAPPTLRSRRAILSPSRRCGRPADFPVSACHPLAEPMVCSRRRLSGRCVSSAGPADPLVAACHLRPPRRGPLSPRQLSCHRVSSARRDGAVRAPATIRSPRVIRSPRWPSASGTDACDPLAEPTLCSPRPLPGHRVVSARHADGVFATPTVRSRRGVRTPRRRCARLANVPVATRLPLALPPVCSPRQLSGRRVLSACRDGGKPTWPTFRSQGVIRSQCWPSAISTGAYHPLAAPAVCSPRRLSGCRAPSARHTAWLLAVAPRAVRSPRPLFARRVPSGHRAVHSLSFHLRCGA